MQDWHQATDTPEDADVPTQEAEQSDESENPFYETDSGTDSNEDLHSGAEPR